MASRSALTKRPADSTLTSALKEGNNKEALALFPHAIKRRGEKARALTDAGANVDARSKSGNTALMAAVSEGPPQPPRASLNKLAPVLYDRLKAGRGAAGAQPETINAVSGLMVETGRGAAGAQSEAVNAVSGLMVETGRGAAGAQSEAVNAVSGLMVETGRGAAGAQSEAVNAVSGLMVETGRGATGAQSEAVNAVSELMVETGRGAAGAQSALGLRERDGRTEKLHPRRLRSHNNDENDARGR